MQGEREVLLLLGGNTGDPKCTLAAAEAALEERVGKVVARSRDHWTEPWGFADDRPFLNKAVLIATSMAPEELLIRCLAIETELGRRRGDGVGYAARPIDIDILLIGDEVIGMPGLQVPHPRMQDRAFALAPAADIAPGAIHPVRGLSILDLLNELRPA
ncbi:MAG: 2-amino-4-hydroxy-6-hydroxymethyldihydropteridine diphosphokinase [Flavobacteriales bacterium]